jgi:hypothetical protein
MQLFVGKQVQVRLVGQPVAALLARHHPKEPPAHERAGQLPGIAWSAAIITAKDNYGRGI